MKERVSQALSSCPMICSCVWWFASAICGNSRIRWSGEPCPKGVQ